MKDLLLRVPITSLPVGLAISAALAGVIALRTHHRYRRGSTVPNHRHAWSMALVLLLVLDGAWGVNTYFDYLPTVGALVGRRAADQAPARVLTVATPPVSVSPQHGQVVRMDIPGTVSGFHTRAAQIYLPPAWFRKPRPPLPVLELIAGEPGTPEDWTRAGFADLTSDRLARRNQGEAPILVMPDGYGAFDRDTECVNGRQGNAETYLSVDVPTWFARHVETASRSGQWGVGGLSAGGYCAAMLALRHPEKYDVFLDFGGLDEPTHQGGPTKLFTGSPASVANQVRDYSISHLLSRPTSRSLRGWFEVGSADGATTRAVIKDARLARRRLAATVLVVIPRGHHTFRVWHHSLRDSLPWADHHLRPWLCSGSQADAEMVQPCRLPRVNPLLTSAPVRPHPKPSLIGAAPKQ